MMTPREIVKELDRYIIGQDAAKRAVAVALRNRYRRSMLDDDMRAEVTPKNMMMMGPTGVGKTEIARRLAKLVQAPFVKVEATKFTEVGYVGRDVESIVRDLVEAAIRMVKHERVEAVGEDAKKRAEDALLDLLAGAQKPKVNPIDALLGNLPKQPELPAEEKEKRLRGRDEVRAQLLAGELEDRLVDIEVDENIPGAEIPGTDVKLQDMLGSIMPKRKKLRTVKVREARRLLEAEEADKLVDMDSVYEEALRRAENDGIVFIDEIDKIAGKQGMQGPDVSREGVQRDILPIVEGSTVTTKYGAVKTDYMLFIGAGAFHVAKVTDLIPELQGRFPVRVELLPLTEADFKRILTQPENAIIKQYQALLAVDHVRLVFEDSALDVLARAAYLANENAENIGARRLHTILENLLEDVSFHVVEDADEVTVTIDAAYVREHLGEAAEMKDLKKHIL